MIAKVWDWPAARVKGGIGPLSAKEVPVTEIFDTLSGEPPVLLTLTYCVALEAAVMLPNNTFAGEIVIWAGLAAGPTDMPVPLSPKVAVVCEFRLLVMEKLPVTASLLIGLNTTAKLVVLAASNVKGKERPSMLNPAPLTSAETMVIEIFPVLESVAVFLADVPAEMFPNASAEGEKKTEY